MIPPDKIIQAQRERERNLNLCFCCAALRGEWQTERLCRDSFEAWGCEAMATDGLISIYAAIVSTSALLLNFKNWFDSGVKLKLTLMDDRRRF